jgi:hypothetical protein
MSRLLTIIPTILTIFVMLFTVAHGAMALPSSPVERARIFADCAGRYAALSMHQSFFDGAASETADAQYHLFLDLLEAVREDAMNDGLPGRQLLHWRVESRAAHATLVHRATYNPDPIASDLSRQAAERYISLCDRLLPGS